MLALPPAKVAPNRLPDGLITKLLMGQMVLPESKLYRVVRVW